MAVKVEVSKASMRVLDLSIGLYQRQLGKDMYNAVKKAAYEVSRSLIARTKRSKAGPKVALATKADMNALVDMIKYTGRNGESPESWRAYVKSLGRKAWITRSDRKKDKGYRHKRFWLKTQWTREQVKKVNEYEYRGLAKQSWRWCASKTKTGASSGQWSDKLETNCSVRPWRLPNGGQIRIQNRLPYIVKALTSPSAVDDACRAAAKQLRHWAKEAMEKARTKQGLAAS